MASTTFVGTRSCRFHPAFYCDTADVSGCRACAENDRKCSRRGCTPIDHCQSIVELMRRPFFAVPVHLVGYLRAATLSRVSVTRPSQLKKRLVVFIPEMQQAIGYDLLLVYEEMLAQLGLPPLEDEVREARMLDPASRASKYSNQFGHADAPHKDSLRSDRSHKVQFLPFYVFPRVGSVFITEKNN
jgi:hypothetical protein